MPSKNTVKIYYENSYFHVYNRGVEKRIIFIDEQDCQVFLHYLKLYLSSKNEIEKSVTFGNTKAKFVNLNLEKEVELLVFSLMPNHFHLLLKQYSIDGITKLLKRITTSYVMYFNKRYKRVGPLFQGIFKACPVESDEYLLHLSRYIHLNSTKLQTNIDFASFSSYQYYNKTKEASWIKPAEILAYFKKRESGKFTYTAFVQDYLQASEELLGEQVLEENCLE